MRKLLLILTLISTQVFAKGDPTEDFQIWVPVNINAKLSENWRGFLEVQPRIGNNAQDLNVAIVRPAIGYALNSNWTVWGGYLMQSTRNSTTNDYEIENRSWQGLTFKEKYDNNIVEVRNRLEQRFLPHNHDISHRWRTRVRVEHLFDQSPWSLIASEEIFVNLNNNDVNSNLQEGANQNRAYAGVGYRFNPNFQVETGYLNNYVFNSSPATLDQTNNVWMSNLNINF